MYLNTQLTMCKYYPYCWPSVLFSDSIHTPDSCPEAITSFNILGIFIVLVRMCMTLNYVSFIFSTIIYWLCYYSCLEFPPFTPLYPALPTPSGNPHTIVHVHESCIQVLCLLSLLYCTLHLHGYSVTAYKYFLIPSPLHLLAPIPSGNHQNALHSHVFVSVLVCLVHFLESIVDRYVFFFCHFIVHSFDHFLK